MALSREALVQLNREQLIDQLMETRVLLDQKASLAKRKEQEVVLLRGRLRKAEERVKATEARNGELQRVLAAVREAGLLAEEGENGAVGGQQEEGVAAGPHQPPGASALHPDSTPSASRMGALGVHMNGPNSATPGAPIVTPAALGVDDGVAAGQALEALLASPQVEAYRMPGSASGLGMPRS